MKQKKALLNLEQGEENLQKKYYKIMVIEKRVLNTKGAL